jgi:cell division transport system permease protein
MYLKTAISNIRRSPFQAMVIVSVLSVTFFVASIIGILFYSSAQVLNYFETRPQVIAFLKTNAKDGDINALQSKLTADSRIKDVKFVTKDEALSIYKNATSSNPLLSQLVSPSIFPASLEFSVKDLTKTSKIIDEVKKEPIVDSVSFTASLGDEGTIKDVLSRLTKVTFYIRIGGLVLAGVLAATSFLVLMTVVSMKIASKRQEFDTLKIMGATNAFIKTPIIFEAIVYVTIAVTIGWLLSMILILYVAPTFITYFASVPVLPKNNLSFIELNLIILGVELVTGIIIAALGGFAAVTRAVNK